MTQTELFDMLASSGFPVTYYQWKVGAVPALPYVVYFYPGTDNFSADNNVYVQVNTLYVELYTENKDFNAESQIESVLQNICGYWNKSETYIESEQMYQTLYECEVIINAD